MLIFKMALFLSFLIYNIALADGGKQEGVKVFSAQGAPKGSFSLKYQREYSRSKNIQFSGDNDLHASLISLNYVPFSFAQLFLNQKTILNNHNDLLAELHSVNFSKTELGTLLTYPLASNYFIGIEPEFVLFNGNGSQFFQASSAALRLLNTYTYSMENQTLRLHWNSQFFWDRSRKITEGFNFSFFNQNQLYGITKYYTINHGLGLELEFNKMITPFVEYTLDQTINSDIPFFKNPNRLTDGFKILPYQNSPWKLTLGSEYGFSKKRYEHVSLTPKLIFFAGLTFTDQPKLVAQTSSSKGEPAQIQVTDMMPSVYPIYPVIQNETSAAQKAKTPVKKVAKKKIKKKKTIEAAIPIEENKSEEIKTVSEPLTPKQKTESPRYVPTFEKPVIERKEVEPETSDVFSTKDSPNGVSEEAPNKNFLIHFR